MGNVLKFLYAVIFAGIIGGGAYLLFWDIPAPQKMLVKEIKLN